MPFPSQFSSNKQGAAQDDARSMQSYLEGLSIDPRGRLKRYKLEKLVGKGSFGRVYKSLDRSTNNFVAIKIINIDEGDRQNPDADTANDIRREIETLRAVAGEGSKNINAILDDYLVGSFICVVTEFCAGGSVSTLMKAHDGVPEKWIIPILREVAEALRWVHGKGIVHRDVKCANVLIDEQGQVQLCDFGVAGIVETRFDKRTTFIGTLHWMAPEIFQGKEYGKEVDVWALGSLAYEVASGLPPNARHKFADISSFGDHLISNVPRLTGDQYSHGLKDLVAYCLVEDRNARPRIEHVQKHQYIHKSADAYPTSSLSGFVSHYRQWEASGGIRASLFSAGGAQRPDVAEADFSILQEDWTFEDTEDDLRPTSQGSPTRETQEMVVNKRRRDPPPSMKNSLPKPLERIFDPNTVTAYTDDSRHYYRLLPLRSESQPLQNNVKENVKEMPRDSLIDLDAAMDMTVKPTKEAKATKKNKHRPPTMEWMFPKPTTSHNITISHAPSDLGISNTGTGKVKSTESTDMSTSIVNSRLSSISLIDLDDSLPVRQPSPWQRLSMTGSDITSNASDTGETPFALEHTFRTSGTDTLRAPAPSFYAEDGFWSKSPSIDETSRDTTPHEETETTSQREATSSYFINVSPPRFTVPQYSNPKIPPLPDFPSIEATTSLYASEDMKTELKRMIGSLGAHLEYSSGILAGLPVRSLHESTRDASLEDCDWDPLTK